MNSPMVYNGKIKIAGRKREGGREREREGDGDGECFTQEHLLHSGLKR